MTDKKDQARALALIRKHGHPMAHNLAVHCISAAKEVVDVASKRGFAPPGVTLTGAAMALLSLRAAIDLESVRQKYGKEAHHELLAAMDKCYVASGIITVPRGFILQVAIARDTMRKESDPTDWLRRQCVRLLETRDPQDELFHLALARGFSVGTSIVTDIEELLANS